MNEALLSPYWHRAASLHPRLASSVTITAHQVRQERWYVISDRVSGRQLRVNALAHELVGRLDGHLSLQQIWDALVWRLGEDTLSQHEILRIVSALSEAGMLISENTPYLGKPRQAGGRQRGSGLGLLSIKVPVLDPTPLLARLAWLSRILFRRASLVAWVLMMLAAVVLGGLQWKSLQDYAAVHLLGTSNLMWAWLLYPLVKLCHELAHGLAVRRWGGEVREMGVSLFLVVPVPYVDASAASAFPEKHRRMLVSAAGILVETTLAFLALLLWMAAQDGPVREAAFAVMTIGGLSTVLVNANPLMRYDGYHLLADALELPNLAPRSTTWLRYAGERYILGNKRLREPQVRPGERPWLVGYGIAAAVYRLAFFLGLITWVGGKYLLAGAVVAVFALVHVVLVPGGRLIQHALFGNRLRAVRGRATLAVACLLTVGVYVLFALPVPVIARTEGVVWIPEDAHVRNAAEGTIDRVLAHDGETVAVGQPLLELSNPELRSRRDQLQARLQGRQRAHSAMLLAQPAAAAAMAQEIGKLVAEIEEVDRLLAALVVRSPYDGLLAWSRGGQGVAAAGRGRAGADTAERCRSAGAAAPAHRGPPCAGQDALVRRRSAVADACAVVRPAEPGARRPRGRAVRGRSRRGGRFEIPRVELRDRPGSARRSLDLGRRPGLGAHRVPGGTPRGTARSARQAGVRQPAGQRRRHAGGRGPLLSDGHGRHRLASPAGPRPGPRQLSAEG